MSGAHCQRFPECMEFSEAPRAPKCNKHLAQQRKELGPMTRYAIAFCSLLDNDLKIFFAETDKGWKEAFSLALSEAGWSQEPIDQMPDDLEEAKQWAFDGDFIFDVRELPK